MTIANEICKISIDSDDAQNRAEEFENTMDEDWNYETTIYTFDDNSVLVLSERLAQDFISRKKADAFIKKYYTFTSNEELSEVISRLSA